MRRYLHPLLVVGLMLGLVACDAFSTNAVLNQIPSPDDSALPDRVRQQYQEDAAQLALRRIARTHPKEQTVELPSDLVQLYYDALIHVYNADELQGRDAIANIHTFPRRSTREAIVAVDTTVAWTQAWRAGDARTGQPAVDALVERHDLAVEYKPWASQHAAIVRAGAPLNTIALSQRFESIQGVEYAEPNGQAGDGADINAELTKNAVVLRYSQAWGDCPSGCIHRETWTFRVEADGAVRFQGHDGP